MPEAPADSFYSDENVHVRVEVFFCSNIIGQQRKRARAMNQHGAIAKQITFVQGLAVRACELRLERHARNVSGKEQVEYICGASGGPEHGHVLGVVGKMSAICSTCPIP